MSELYPASTKELEVIRKTALFLRNRLIIVKRDGPLVKLLDREIELLNDELANRLEAASKAKPSNSMPGKTDETLPSKPSGMTPDTGSSGESSQPLRPANHR